MELYYKEHYKKANNFIGALLLNRCNTLKNNIIFLFDCLFGLAKRIHINALPWNGAIVDAFAKETDGSGYLQVEYDAHVMLATVLSLGWNVHGKLSLLIPKGNIWPPTGLTLC